MIALARYGALACVLALVGCGDKDSSSSAAPAAPPKEARPDRRPGPGGPEASARKPLGVGSAAPDFALEAHDGRTIELSKLNGPVVLYFYPKDDTPG